MTTKSKTPTLAAIIPPSSVEAASPDLLQALAGLTEDEAAELMFPEDRDIRTHTIAEDPTCPENTNVRCVVREVEGYLFLLTRRHATSDIWILAMLEGGTEQAARELMRKTGHVFHGEPMPHWDQWQLDNADIPRFYQFLRNLPQEAILGHFQTYKVGRKALREATAPTPARTKVIEALSMQLTLAASALNSAAALAKTLELTDPVTGTATIRGLIDATRRIAYENPARHSLPSRGEADRALPTGRLQ